MKRSPVALLPNAALEPTLPGLARLKRQVASVREYGLPRCRPISSSFLTQCIGLVQATTQIAGSGDSIDPLPNEGAEADADKVRIWASVNRAAA